METEMTAHFTLFLTHVQVEAMELVNEDEEKVVKVMDEVRTVARALMVRTMAAQALL